MNRAPAKNKAVNRNVMSYIAANKNLAKDRTLSSDSSGVDSVSEPLISSTSCCSVSSGGDSASEALLASASCSSISSSRSNSTDSCSIGLSKDVQDNASSFESLSISDSFDSLTVDSEKSEKSDEAEEAAKHESSLEEAVEADDEEVAKAAMIAKLMDRYKVLGVMHNKVTNVQTTNNKIVEEVKTSTDRMMNLMEGSSVTEPLHLFLRRKTKYNML